MTDTGVVATESGRGAEQRSVAVRRGVATVAGSICLAIVVGQSAGGGAGGR